MRLERKNKVAVLKYRVVFEELEQAEYELKEGAASLASHLVFFREKLSTQNVSQVASFDNVFFSKGESAEIVSKSKDEKLIECSELQAVDHPQWAKKLHKKIALVTHPDRTSQIKIDSLEEKLNAYYMLAIDSYKKSMYQNLLMIAADLDIEFDQKLIKEHIQPAINKYKKELIGIQSKPGYLWYHVPEENKKDSLKDHLTKMGFVFTDSEVDEAIKTVRAKNQRKRGSRPVKSGRIRLK